MLHLALWKSWEKTSAPFWRNRLHTLARQVVNDGLMIDDSDGGEIPASILRSCFMCSWLVCRKCTANSSKKRDARLTLCTLQAQIWAEQKFLMHAAGPDMGPSTFRLLLPSVDRSDAKQAGKICSIFSIGSFVLSVTKIYHGLQ